NFFANTPDILHEYLQTGGRPAFEARLVLAATPSPSYGIYSRFESFENVPVREGSGGYLGSEQDEVKRRSPDRPLHPPARTRNRARRENAALQLLENVTFLETENERLFAYVKRTGANVVIACVNLDPFTTQQGLAIVPAASGLPPAFPVVDLLGTERYTWHVGRNYVSLPPGQSHLMRAGA